MQKITNTKKYIKLLILFLIFVVILCAIYYGVIQKQQPFQNISHIKINGVVLAQPRDIAPFSLIDSNNNLFTKESLKKHWTMMFFGFTNCEIFCPTTMVALNKMYHILQKELQEHELPQIVFVTVDPERDTISKMKNYIMAFNSQFLGVSGKLSEVVAFEKQLNILAVKIHTKDQEENDYTIDHTTDILLFNPEGKLQAYLSRPYKPKIMSEDYKNVLHKHEYEL